MLLKRTPKAFMTAIGAAASLGLALVLGVETWRAHDEALADEFRELSHLVRVLEEHASRTLDTADIVLQRMDELIRQKGMAEFSASRLDWESFRRTADMLPQLSSLVVVDAQGRTVFGTGAFPAEVVSVADRPYFHAHKSGTRLYLGEPIRGRTSGKRLFSVSRRIPAPDGGFGGLAVAFIDYDYFRSFYESLDQGKPLTIGMYREDGITLVRHPVPESQIGMSVAHTSLFADLLVQAPAGTWQGASPFDGVQRLAGYRHSGSSMPFVVTVASDRNEVLAGWRRLALRNLVTFLALNVGLVALVVAGRRLLAAQDAATREKLEAARFVQSVLDSLSAHVAILDEGGMVVKSNRAWDDFAGSAGAERDALRGSNYLAACHAIEGPDRTTALAAAGGIQGVLEGRSSHFVLDYACHDPGGAKRWFNLRATRLTASDQAMVVVAHEDITNIMRAQEAAAESEARSRQSERLYRTIAHNIPNGAVMVFDRELRYIFADGQGLADIGLRPDEVRGRTVWQTLDGITATLVAPLCADAMAGRSAEGEVPFGGRIYRMTVIPIRDEAGRIEQGLALTQDITRLRTAQHDLEEANARLLELSSTDGLLGIANRRHFDRMLEAEWSRSLRNGNAVGLLLLDVDHFKIFNDSFGHLEGDACLKRIAQVMQGCIGRGGDLVARYGGEEMAVMLPNVDLAGTLKVAARIHARLAETPWAFPQSPTVDRVTVSIGAAALIPAAGQSHTALIEAADAALYLAKRSGRNRTAATDANGALISAG